MKYYAILCLLFFTSCVPKLSPEAMQVRPVTADYKDAHCSFIGITQSFGAAIEGGYIAALNKLRQSVANAGGNAFKIISERPIQMGEFTHYEITAEALKCKTTTNNNSSTSTGSDNVQYF